MTDPKDWPDEDPSKVVALAGQRDEFQRRAQQSRKALEDARNAYERGDLDGLGVILRLYTGWRVPKAGLPTTTAIFEALQSRPADEHGCDASNLVPLEVGPPKLRWCCACGSLLDGDTMHPPSGLVGGA